MTPTHAREQRFDELYERHVEALRRYAWRRDPQLADDVVAETLVVAWRRLDEIPGDAELPWLIGVARKARLNLTRSSRRQAAVSSRLAESAVPAADEAGVEAPAALWSAL